jgi:hypothetical protein
MQSLEDLGVLTDGSGENLHFSVVAQGGQDARGQLAAIMQDLGVFLAIDMSTGLLKFVPVREPAGTLPYIPNDAILDEPEIEVAHGPRSVDRIVYTFPDATLAYRDATISIDDDGQATRLQYFQSRTAQIVSTVNFETAARIAERRSAEELAGVYENRIELGREARALLPGTPILVEGLDEVQRVISTEHDTESGRVTVAIWNDFYGVPLSEFVSQGTVPPGTGSPTEPDPLAAFFEVPEVLQVDKQVSIIPLMVRSGTHLGAGALRQQPEELLHAVHREHEARDHAHERVGGLDEDRESACEQVHLRVCDESISHGWPRSKGGRAGTAACGRPADRRRQRRTRYF